MVLGVRPIGTRTIGDGAGDSGVSSAPVTGQTRLGRLAVQVLTTIEYIDLDPPDLTTTFNGTLDTTTVIDLYPAPLTTTFNASLELPHSGTDRSTRAVTMNGTVLGTLADALHGAITWELNQPVSFSITNLAADSKAGLILDDAFQEVQLYRGDQLLTWGTIIRPNQGLQHLNAYCSDILWYLSKRLIGRANRTNYFCNPSFEDGLACWGVGNEAPVEWGTEGGKPEYSLGAVSADRSVSGRYSARTETPNDTYPLYGSALAQAITWEVGTASKDGDIWTASIWVYIPSSTLRSLEGASVNIGRYDPNDLVPVYNLNGVFVGNFPRTIEVSTAPMTGDFPLDKWTKVEVALEMPVTGELEILQFHVHLPKGVAYFDDASLTYNERMEWFATDQATIVTELIEHLQDPDYGKSDLNIEVDAPLTGVLRDQTYLFSEHVNGLRALEDFTRLAGGFDMWMRYTPTTRTFVISSPESGTLRPRCHLKLNAELVDFDWNFDGERAASAVVTLGDGQGSGRVEGYATDTTDYANGLILEEVFAAGLGTPASALDALAEERVQVTRRPEVLTFRSNPDPELTTRLLGGCRVGDYLPITIYVGALEITDTYRLVRLTLNPDDSLSGTLNIRTPPA